ncbi:class I SAM-dependent methyltransferase [Methylosinus sp. sav-2]|uniref:class I SAM-dependent methyltransferase n=1 Tax=Methylosinus sp. sav-2 TaxID=2485168 RepID=UPI001066A3BF|nr:class I SAM-dependent methyltransferase [Methylosinus sp. sav-2]
MVNKAKSFYLRILRFRATYGILEMVKRSYVLMFGLDPYKNAVKAYSDDGNAVIFSKIYDSNLWKTKESRSGRGSTIVYTESIRHAMPSILRTYSIKYFLDAPCGDFNWMRAVDFPDDCVYFGVDIVQKMIESNRTKYGESDKRRFGVLDITCDPIPRVDMVFCRDCLFHLSLEDIFKFLENFAKSESKFLMTSTHKNRDGFPNSDIKSGDFRVIDLFSEPFCLTSDVLARVDDYQWPDPEREMCVWSREAVNTALKHNGRLIEAAV